MSNCPSCREPLDYPSGDGCAAMTMHKEKPMSDDLVKRLRHPVGGMRPTISDGRAAAHRIEELEAKLAKAVECVAWCAVYEENEVARTALAELTGGKDD